MDHPRPTPEGSEEEDETLLGGEAQAASEDQMVVGVHRALKSLLMSLSPSPC